MGFCPAEIATQGEVEGEEEDNQGEKEDNPFQDGPNLAQFLHEFA
jgi:hypothetical protein